MINKDIQFEIQQWVREAVSDVSLGSPDEVVRYVVGAFVGFFPDGDEVGNISSEWSTAIGIYLDIPGVEPLAEQRTFGTVIVQPWGVTEQMVKHMVDDALRRMFRDRHKLAVEGRKRLDDAQALDEKPRRQQ